MSDEILLFCQINRDVSLLIILSVYKYLSVRYRTYSPWPDRIWAANSAINSWYVSAWNLIPSLLASKENRLVSSRCTLPSSPKTSYQRYSNLKPLWPNWHFRPSRCLISCAGCKNVNSLSSGDIRSARSWTLGMSSQRLLQSRYFFFSPLCL